MKKILTVGIALFFMNTLVNAQIFKPFKVDVAIGAAIPSGNGTKGGVLFALEPKYAVMDKVSVGLRLEAAVTARAAIAPDGSAASGKVAASGSYLATGDYYFNTHVFRPFAGAGAGIFTLASSSFDGSTTQGATTSGISASTQFGGMVRAGFEVGHFRLAVEYNLIPQSTQTVTYTTQFGSGSTNVTTKNSYLGIKLGFFFGGGRI